MLTQLGTNPDPEFVEQTVFLQQLVSGGANLYYYREGSIEQFFASSTEIPLMALVYKEYREGNKISTNNNFRYQLYKNFSCNSNKEEGFGKTDYKQKDLVKHFKMLNSCRDWDYQVFEEEGKKIELNIKMKAGLKFSKLRIDRGIYVSGNEIDLEPSLTPGLEVEMVMPFNRNKWSFFADAFYNRHVINNKHLIVDWTYNRHEVDLSFDLQYVSLTGGLRHYLFLADQSKIHFSAGLTYDVELSSSILIDRDERYELDPQLEDLSYGVNLNFGLGYTYRRYTIEARYSTPRQIKGSRAEDHHYVLDWNSKMSSFSIVVGYKIL
jgi:hypothetical protein